MTSPSQRLFPLALDLPNAGSPSSSGSLYSEQCSIVTNLHKGSCDRLGRAGLLHGAAGPSRTVTYTLDSDGLGIAPPWHKDDLACTTLFFGCSCTFGEGPQDRRWFVTLES